MSGRILVVDDDTSHRRTLERHLGGELGYEVEAAESGEKALSTLGRFDPDVVLTDIRMPGMSGLELLEHIKSLAESVDVIMITAFEDMQTAISAMKAGAYDYMVKPLDLDRLEVVVERCFRDRSLRRRARALEDDAKGGSVDALVGKDPRMIEIYKVIGKVSQSATPVLVRGETGTGKEVIARTIHHSSGNAREPFVAVNCTALAENLLESELFGHVKGAFTGAVTDRKGRFELAGSGTIFLDEIGDTDVGFQAELLRVLQEKEYYPVGGEHPRKTAARVIAATHRPLERMVKEGSFREDLYFRLRVVEIVVPPLRDRRGDIPLLARHILEKVASSLHKEVPIIAEPALAALMAYDWPGNVRELENTLTRALVLANGPAITVDHLSVGTDAVGPGMDSAPPLEGDEQSLEALERVHVQRVLLEQGGNKTRTADILGISRPRLDRIIARHKLIVP